ncbi:MAG: TraB/GumN family protein [Saprospiraceae bacterium]|nr:TraB/GumN family protein [Saprospiraceae bacterium]MDW8229322.1 TraB/GumN family protein [Saprospiraceae bacterium]
MSFFWRVLALLAAGGLVWSCGSASKAVLAPEALAPKERALLWKVSGKGLRQPSYLLGTIHLIPKEQFAVSNATREALSRVGRIAFEIDLKEMGGLAVFKVMSKTFMSGGQTLRNLLSEEDYALVREQVSKRSMLPMSTLERMKPMFVASMLERESNDLSENKRMTSVEVELYRLARKRKIATAGLETIEYQLSLFDSIPYALQARMLVEQLRQESNAGEEFARMVSLYQQKDLQGMEAMTRESFAEEPTIQEALIYRRNRDWIPIIVRMMREQPTFFAVGAGHLGGTRGVIALLRKEGYRVEAVD